MSSSDLCNLFKIKQIHPIEKFVGLMLGTMMTVTMAKKI